MLYINYILLMYTLTNQELKGYTILLIVLSYLLIGLGAYLLNDYFDVEADKNAGKTSTTDLLSPLVFKLTVVVSWLIGSSIIYFLSASAAFVLLIQLFVLFIYSHPFVRLKEKSILGVLADALYAHVLPVIILFILIPEGIDYYKFALFIWFNFLVGIRDILLHQKADLVGDRLNGSSTFMVKREKVGLLLINVVDLGALVSLSLFFSLSIEWQIFVFLSLAVLIVKMLFSYKQYIELNYLVQFYVIVSTSYVVYWLIRTENYFWLIFLLHPYTIGFSKTVLSLFRRALSAIINYPLYYIALLCGRNLKKDPFKW